MSIINVHIKWGKIQLKDVPLNTAEAPSAFKEKVLELTGVPIARQKLLIPKCPQLKDDPDWSKFPNLKEGVTIMLIGSAEVIDKSIVPEAEVPMEVEESVHVPPGLANLDNTCYFNSSVQVISSLDLVRKSLFSLNGNENSNDADKKLAVAFQRTVTDLRNSTKTVYPFELVTIFRRAFPQFDQKGDDGRYMQQDAEECFSQFLQSLSRYLPPISSPYLENENNAISQLFAGKFDVAMKTLRADGSVDESKRTENFLKLSCHIQNETSFLQQALESSLNETISGEGDVLHIEKVSRISKLPYYLPIQYVRFFWKSDKNVRAKILKPVDVPLELDVYQICSEELKQKLKTKRDVDGIPPAVPVESDAGSKDEILENQTGRYELTAVISHKGRSADGGHYVAWVRDKGDDWFLFDDTNVSMVKTKDVRQLSGHGGADWHIAYVCLYTTKN